jgi:hypothetical protein
MSRYIFIHRLTGPAILLLLGIVALLHEAHLVSWNIFVPLLLILIGVIKLAERAAIAAEPYPPGVYPPGAPYADPMNPSAAPGAPQAPVQTSIVPASHDFGHDPNDPNGGRS